jgi:lipid-A-disaccharide synthase
MTSILIVAGEDSGEGYGADAIREFRKLWPSASFFGIGGKRMAEQGVDLVFSVDDLSAVGIVEVLGRLPHFRRMFRRLEREIDARRPAASVLIDSPDFNLRLAKKLKALGIPVLYYISPTVWAWRSGRLKRIREVVSRMLLIFPFEQKIYQDQGIPAAFVGHPLAGKVRVQLGRKEFLAKYGLSGELPLVCLLPGSRPTELKYHLPVLRGAVKKIRQDLRVQFVLVLARSASRAFLSRVLAPEENEITILESDGYEAMAYSDLILSACGTANLEAALLGTPLVAFYRLSPLTYYPFRWLLKIHDYSIVNILAGKRVVPELIQHQFNARRLAEEARLLLTSEERRNTIKAELARIRAVLGQERAPENVARHLATILGGIQTT